MKKKYLSFIKDFRSKFPIINETINASKMSHETWEKDDTECLFVPSPNYSQIANFFYSGGTRTFSTAPNNESAWYGHYPLLLRYANLQNKSFPLLIEHGVYFDKKIYSSSKNVELVITFTEKEQSFLGNLGVFLPLVLVLIYATLKIHYPI